MNQPQRQRLGLKSSGDVATAIAATAPSRSPACGPCCAHHIAEAHVQCFPCSTGSTASQVGATAWFPLYCGSGWALMQCSERASATDHCSCRPARMARPTSVFVLLPQLRSSRLCAGHSLARGFVFNLFCSANLLL